MPARDHDQHSEVVVVRLDTVAIVDGVVNLAHANEADFTAVRLMGATESV